MLKTAQIVTDGDWLPDYPAASSYIPSFFSCDGDHGNGFVCNQSVDQEMNDALALQLDNPAQAAALWTRIDHQITNDAYWVPTVTVRYIDFVSTRVHNYQFNPVWGFIADQAWIK